MSIAAGCLVSAVIILGATGYGLLFRLVLGLPGLRDRLDPLSFGFLFGQPCATGFLAGLAGCWLFPGSFWLAVALAVAAEGLFVVCLRLCGWQRLLSILMALPVFLAMAGAGGMLAPLLLLRHVANPVWILSSGGLILALPLVCVVVESLVPAREVFHWVRTTQVVRARPRTIWEGVIRVAPIHKREWRLYRIFAMLGFPAPERAILSDNGPDGLRQGIFSGRVLFDEPVIAWKPYSLVRFAVHVRPDALVGMPFDEFTRLGGRYVDVVAAEYRLETQAEGQVCVHLNSLYRLRTRLNFYTGWWARLVLRTFQRSILAVIQHRCEEHAIRGRLRRPANQVRLARR
jgi:hypothetical protein